MNTYRSEIALNDLLALPADSPHVTYIGAQSRLDSLAHTAALLAWRFVEMGADDANVSRNDDPTKVIPAWYLYAEEVAALGQAAALQIAQRSYDYGFRWRDRVYNSGWRDRSRENRIAMDRILANLK